MMHTVMTLLLFAIFLDHNDCKTTMRVLDCYGTAVQGADVEVKNCKTQEVTRKTTDEKGEVVFDLCKSEICATKIITNKRPREVSPTNCKGEEKETICEFRLCD